MGSNPLRPSVLAALVVTAACSSSSRSFIVLTLNPADARATPIAGVTSVVVTVTQPPSFSKTLTYPVGSNKPPLVIDGPFAETKEQLLGFYVIDVADLDEALEVARELAAANPGGAYELRPIALYNPDKRGGTSA